MFKKKNVNYGYYAPFNWIRIRIIGVIKLIDAVGVIVFGHFWPNYSLRFMFWELQTDLFDSIRKENNEPS